MYETGDMGPNGPKCDYDFHSYEDLQAKSNEPPCYISLSSVTQQRTDSLDFRVDGDCRTHHVSTVIRPRVPFASAPSLRASRPVLFLQLFISTPTILSVSSPVSAHGAVFSQLPIDKPNTDSAPIFILSPDALVEIALRALGKADIVPTEWGALVYREMNAPVPVKNFSYIIPDEQLALASSILQDIGLPLSEPDPIFVATGGEIYTSSGPVYPSKSKPPPAAVYACLLRLVGRYRPPDAARSKFSVELNQLILYDMLKYDSHWIPDDEVDELTALEEERDLAEAVVRTQDWQSSGVQVFGMKMNRGWQMRLSKS
ncbi:hypothetical protein C8J56DRAFT_883362 [Mycena floridula]|nr:hypothetical protein C8J56DRAFT_883362 [Mycena floridula]